MPREIQPAEELTRFLFNESDYSSAKKLAKQKAFSPEMYKGRYETSMCRLAAATPQRISHLSRTIRYPRVAKARVQIPCSAIDEAMLLVDSAPIACYREHAVLLGWASGSGDNKAAQMAAKAVLVKHSRLIVEPQ